MLDFSGFDELDLQYTEALVGNSITARLPDLNMTQKRN